MPDVKVDINHVIDHPEEYGIRWDFESLERDKREITKRAPIPVFIDLTKGVEFLGAERWLAMADGSSYRVKVQGRIRDAIWKDRSVESNQRAMQRMAIETLLGTSTRAPGSRQVFLGLDRKPYPTQLEMNQANLAHLVDKGMSVEDAKEILDLE